MLTCLYDVVGYALIGFMCFMCLFPCYMVISLSSHAYMLGFMFFQVYVLSFHMFTCTFLCLYAQIYVFTCLCAWIYVLCMLYVIFHMFVCSKPCSSCHVLLQPFCSFVSFLCFGIIVRTQSRPYGLCHRPYTKTHIKGFGSSLFACLCLLISMLYACVSLSCSRLYHVQCLQQVCGCMVTFATHGALFGCSYLGCITIMSVASCIPFPFPAPWDDMLAMLAFATRYLSMHLQMLAYMFMHESCLPVCYLCFNIMKLWTFDPNLHLSLTDTTFCLLSCLFVFSLVCLFACFLISLLVCHSYFIFSFHCLSTGLLFLPLHVYTWSEDAWRQGIVSQAKAKRARMRACRYKPSGYVQQVQRSSFSHLVLYSLNPPPLSFLLPFSLKWVILGISCHVPSILILKVW